MGALSDTTWHHGHELPCLVLSLPRLGALTCSTTMHLISVQCTYLCSYPFEKRENQNGECWYKAESEMCGAVFGGWPIC